MKRWFATTPGHGGSMCNLTWSRLAAFHCSRSALQKENICVIIPYSPAYQPSPLCPVLLASSNGHHVHVCVCVCVFISAFFFFFFHFHPTSLNHFFLRFDTQVFPIRTCSGFYLYEPWNTEMIINPIRLSTLLCIIVEVVQKLFHSAFSRKIEHDWFWFHQWFMRR